MPREQEQYVSLRTKDAVKGGGGIPGGVTVTIHDDTIFATGHDTPKELAAKLRDKDDAFLKIVLEDNDGNLKAEWLGTGRGFRPSSDGMNLVSRDGSRPGMNEGSGTMIFFKSLEAPKDGKTRLSDDALEAGLKGIIGTKFVTGREVIKRSDGQASAPALVADSIISLPGGKKAKREEEAPARKTKAEAEDFDAEVVCENAIKEALELPKYRKGIPEGKLYEAVVNIVKDTTLEKAQKQEVYALVDQDEDPKLKWAKSAKRDGFAYNEDTENFGAS
jgi:hypothetical protein